MIGQSEKFLSVMTEARSMANLDLPILKRGRVGHEKNY